LVLGQLNLTNTSLPNLYGKTYEEAKSILLSNSLNLGEIYGCEECETETDSAESYIYKQIPEFFEGKTLRTSSKVDLYLTNDKELIDSNDSIERK
jgi:beta-lactam-binding protein with PASTA domain